MHIMSLRLAALVIASLVFGNASAQISINNPFELHDLLDEQVSNGSYPFLYARLESFEGRVLYEYSTVNRELLPDANIDGQSWIRIWSMSKIVTISLAMDLVEEGVISLDDPVADYLPELSDLEVAVGQDGAVLSALTADQSGCPLTTAPAASPITLRNLINHTAGFFYAVTGIECLDSLTRAQNLPGARDTDEFLERLRELPLIQQPGSDYFYGLNTTILGMTLERATGDTLQELLESRLTKPFRIRGMSYAAPDDVTLLPYFTSNDGALRVADSQELDIFGGGQPRYDSRNKLYFGGEGMVATADGYADFLRLLGSRGLFRGQRLLDEATVTEMTAPHTQLDNPGGHNGYNLWVSNGQSTGEPANLWSGGGYEATYFWIDPENEFVAILMSQVLGPWDRTTERNDTFRQAVYRQITP